METVTDLANAHLLVIGKSVITPKILIVLLVSIIALVVVTRWLERWGSARLIKRRGADEGAVRALFQILRYLALVIGLIVIVQQAGIDLSAFVVVVGTLGIGIGLALQPLLTNFIGGLVLLVERPLKVGDRIELGKLNGRVMHIGPRATNIRTNDDIDVIVPNSELASSHIINWSLADRRVRIEIPIGVSYDADPRAVEALLVEVAHATAGVLSEPAPEVLLDRFDDSAVAYVLRVWTETFLDRPRVLRSHLNYQIFAALRARGIAIPFPQRDVHVHPIASIAAATSAPVEAAAVATPVPPA